MGIPDAACGTQASALRSALNALFKEERLPDNPYFFLASVLGAYVDQSPLWRTPPSEVAAAYDLEGGVEVHDANACLCRVLERAAYGLPHVLRLVSKDGEDAAPPCACRPCCTAADSLPQTGR